MLCLHLLAMGKLTSLHYLRAVDPEQVWGRATGGKLQALVVLFFPVLGLPEKGTASGCVGARGRAAGG